MVERTFAHRHLFARSRGPCLRYRTVRRGGARPRPRRRPRERPDSGSIATSSRAGYNSVINQRQFQVPGLEWPTDFRYPDEVYRDRLSLEVGGVTFELHHAKGETDDHTWTWVPEKRVLCCGDLFIWCSPNAGNPQKAQRYPREWAVALREMLELGAEILLPGHGLPVVGADRVRQVLDDTASYLESVVEQTLELMNSGVALDEIVARVEPPADLAAKPYLRPIYDEPDFIVRNMWRLYGGWYDGDPSHLKPAPAPELAATLVQLAGGVESVDRRGAQASRSRRVGPGLRPHRDRPPRRHRERRRAARPGPRSTDNEPQPSPRRCRKASTPGPPPNRAPTEAIWTIGIEWCS